MTFSIVAVDAEANEIGVAVQSRAFAAGARVPFARAGVGGIATQATTNGSYGPRGLDLLAQGLAPADVVRMLTDADQDREVRQLAVIDPTGRSFARTGARCVPWCGHRSGKDFSAQGNMLAGPQVIDAMAAAFQAMSGGDLAGRLLAALLAGQAVGGDARGKQAAGLLVVRPPATPDQTTDRVIDVRVDDSSDPFGEIERLLRLARAQIEAQTSRRLASEGRHDEAIAAQQRAIALSPDDDQLVYGLAWRHAQAGDAVACAMALRQAIAVHEGWRAFAAQNPAFEGVKTQEPLKSLLDG